MKFVLLGAAVLLTAAAWAQTQVDLQRQAKNVPVIVGTAMPATCTAGTLFFKTDAPAGSNLYGCTGTNIWTLLAPEPDTRPSSLLCIDAGSTNAYACDVEVTSYSVGLTVLLQASSTNTGAATLNLSSLGPRPIYKKADQPLSPGDITGGQIVTVVYDGGAFQLQSGAPPESTSPGGLVNGADIAAALACKANSANGAAYACSVEGVASYASPLTLLFVPDVASTGPATLNVNGLGAKPLIRATSNGIVAGELAPQTPYVVTYDGSAFRILNEELESDASGTITINRLSSPHTIGVTPNVFGELMGSNTWSGNNDFSSGLMILPQRTVADLPPAGSNAGKVFVVTDGLTSLDCTGGGGSAAVLCRSNGTTYAAFGGPGGGNVNGSGLITGAPVVGAGGSEITAASKSGDTTEFVTSAGAKTAGNCVQWDASGNVIDAGAACGSGNVSGTELNTGAPVIGAGGSNVSAASKSGNTTEFVTSAGAKTAGNCIKWDENGNAVDAGAACGGGEASVAGGNVNGNNLTAGAPVIGAGGSNISAASKSGDTTEFVTSAGAKNAGNCMEWDANGNAIDAGEACGNVSGAGLTTGAPVIGAGGSNISAASKSGDTTEFVTSAGAKTAGNCVQWDANGNVIDAGAACGSGNVNGEGLTAGAPLIGAGGSSVSAASKSGSTTEFVTSAGAKTAGNCVKWDDDGNVVDAGAACGSGGGGATGPITEYREYWVGASVTGPTISAWDTDGVTTGGAFGDNLSVLTFAPNGSHWAQFKVILPYGFTGTPSVKLMGVLGAVNGGSGNVIYSFRTSCPAAGEFTNGFTWASTPTTAVMTFAPGTWRQWHETAFVPLTLPASGCTAGRPMFVRVYRDNTANPGQSIDNSYVIGAVLQIQRN